MWLKKLRHNRTQFLLVAVILFFTASILSACLCFTLETGNYTKSYYSKENCADFFLLVSGEKAGKSLVDQAKSNKDFTKVDSVKGLAIKEKAEIGGKNITPYFFYLFAIDNCKELSWTLTPVQYIKEETKPGEGEVWVQKLYADLKDIKLGDTITLKDDRNTTLKVSALVDDATNPSTLMGMYPFYVNQNTINQMKNESPISFVTISSAKGEDSIKAWIGKLPPELGGALVITFPVSALILCLSMVSNIMGGIGILSAFLIFAVSIVTIRFLIKSNLMREYRSIGIYKALGYKDGQIKGFYLRCYLLVGAVSLILGAAAGIPLGYYIGTVITKYVAGFHLTGTSLLVAAGAALVLYLLLIVNVRLAYRKINGITPVKALQIGVSSTKKKMTRSAIKNAHSPFAMAVNDICKHKSFSIMYLLTLTVSFYLCIFFASAYYTCAQSQDHPDKWFAIPKADCMISGTITDEMINFVKNNSDTKTTISGSPRITAKIESDKSGADLSRCTILSWDDFNGEQFGLTCTKGREPKNSGEIAVCSKLAQKSSISPGDYLKIKIGDKEKDYLVTGFYNSMMNGGESFEILPGDLKDCGVAYQPAYIAVNLKNPSDFDTFKKDVEQHFPTATIEQQISDVTDSMQGVKDIINPVTGILVVVFILFSLLNIVNLLLTTQLESRRKFGILKSLGFSTGYICRQTFFKTLILSAFSIAAALCLHLAVSAKLFDSMVGVNAYMDSASLLTGLLGGIFTLILIISMVFCIPLSKISPVELMEE